MKKLVLILTLFLFAMATPAFCDEAGTSLEPVRSAPRISQFEVKGNKLISTETILEVFKTKVGDKFSRQDLFEDLSRVNDTGFFDEKSLQLIPRLSEGEVVITVCVSENEPVTGIKIQGNEVLKTEDLTKLLSAQIGLPKNLKNLSDSIDRIEQLYHEQGYVLARFIDVKDDPVGTIAMTINEGRIDAVEIVGDKKSKNLLMRKFLNVKSGSVYNDNQLANDFKKFFERSHGKGIRRSVAPSETNPEMFTLKIEIGENSGSSVPSIPKFELKRRPDNETKPTSYSVESTHPILGAQLRRSNRPAPSSWIWTAPRKPYQSMPKLLAPQSEFQPQ